MDLNQNRNATKACAITTSKTQNVREIEKREIPQNTTPNTNVPQQAQDTNTHGQSLEDSCEPCRGKDVLKLQNIERSQTPHQPTNSQKEHDTPSTNTDKTETASVRTDQHQQTTNTDQTTIHTDQPHNSDQTPYTTDKDDHESSGTDRAQLPNNSTDKAITFGIAITQPRPDYN